MFTVHSRRSCLQMHNRCLAKDNKRLFHAYAESHHPRIHATTYNHAPKARRARPALNQAIPNLVSKLYVFLYVGLYALCAQTVTYCSCYDTALALDGK